MCWLINVGPFKSNKEAACKINHNLFAYGQIDALFPYCRNDVCT